jgi:putative lipoprotein (rSAM/lipoprotein system)
MRKRFIILQEVQPEIVVFHLLNIKIDKMKQNWRRKLLRGLSLTSALFVFQACYGTPHDFGLDIFIEGQVKSLMTDRPIEGIKVSIADKMQYEYTNEEGKFSLYTEIADSYKIKFEDIDSIQNGIFVDRDTLLTNINEKVFLDIVLEEK